MGRYPHKAPLGFINVTGWDGKKYIEIKQPEAGILKWAFQQLAKNSYKIDEVRKMACAKGLKCSRSHFVRLIRNPVYCGFIAPSQMPNEQQIVKGIHSPGISEAIFYEVQSIINTKKKMTFKAVDLNAMFFLKGYLVCPSCGRTCRGSFSSGCSKKYPYYHCFGNCKTRIRADLLNSNYNEKLQQLKLSNKVAELFNLILEDINVSTHKIACLQERKLLLKQLEEQGIVLSKARKLFVADKLQFDDFCELKKEHQSVFNSLKKELNTVTSKLQRIDQQFKLADRPLVDIFRGFVGLDTADKREIVNLISPTNVNIQTGELSIKMDNALLKILSLK